MGCLKRKGGMNMCFIYLTYNNLKRQIYCNLAEGYEKKLSKKTLSKLLQEAKQLNIPLRNFMKAKQELEKSIFETQLKYKDIIFGNHSRGCKGCLKNFENK